MPVLDNDGTKILGVAVDGEKTPFSVTPDALTTVVRIGPDKNPLLRPLPFQKRIFPKNRRAIQLLPVIPGWEARSQLQAAKSMMLRKSPGRPIFGEARTHVRAVLVRMEQNDHTTGAC